MVVLNLDQIFNHLVTTYGLEGRKYVYVLSQFHGLRGPKKSPEEMAAIIGVPTSVIKSTQEAALEKCREALRRFLPMPDESVWIPTDDSIRQIWKPTPDEAAERSVEVLSQELASLQTEHYNLLTAEVTRLRRANRKGFEDEWSKGRKEREREIEEERLRRVAAELKARREAEQEESTRQAAEQQLLLKIFGEAFSAAVGILGEDSLSQLFGGIPVGRRLRTATARTAR